MRPERRVRRVRLAAAAICLLATAAASAASLDVSVDGVPDGHGDIGCALFTDEAGFPLDVSGREQRWLPAKEPARRCHFEELPTGRYAVAVMLDTNGNRRNDTNLLGMPQEAWGVSQNVRPRLRAPRFDEAVLQLDADTVREIVVEVRP